jgi:DNA-binding MarR family transcriptional regulator
MHRGEHRRLVHRQVDHTVGDHRCVEQKYTGPVSVVQLAAASLKCKPRNVTGLVDALQRAGFVERTAYPSDRRAAVVRLSEAVGC